MTAAATGPCSHFVEGGSAHAQMKRQGALASPGGRTLKRLQYAPPTPQPRRMQGIHLDGVLGGYWEGTGRVARAGCRGATRVVWSGQWSLGSGESRGALASKPALRPPTRP